MNWKPEFWKAGELALKAGTLIVLGLGLFMIGKGIWGVAIARKPYDPLDLFDWGVVAIFLITLFFGCYRKSLACAVAAAFMLNFAGSVCIGTALGGILDGWDLDLGRMAMQMFIGSSLFILGFLLLLFRFTRTMLSPIVYVLASVPPIGLAIIAAGMAQTWL